MQDVKDVQYDIRVEDKVIAIRSIKVCICVTSLSISYSHVQRREINISYGLANLR